jgi:hypothetical protein
VTWKIYKARFADPHSTRLTKVEPSSNQKAAGEYFIPGGLEGDLDVAL